MNLQHLILFDGQCGLCQKSVQWIIQHDTRKQFVFASLQSQWAQSLLSEHGWPHNTMDSIRLISPYPSQHAQLYSRSEAILVITKILRHPYRWVLRFCPVFIRDAVYKQVQKNRYRIWGQSETCWVPSLELKGRFLDQ
ncbi:MAG: thiol-disulfide oxidoreductase [Actinobacteria bacterium]|nr:thiol-disulfide oxidoreductase [Actinomycetota bacterium]